jgi:putative sigma-54 modulation protein
MQITIKGRHWKPGPGFREYAEDRIERLTKFYPRLMNAHLTITREGYRHLAELRLVGNSLDLLAKSSDPEATVALDQVLAKQERALRRQNERRKDKRRRGPAARLEPAALEARPLPKTTVRRGPVIVRERARRPTLSAEQAVRALLRSRKPVLVFTERGQDAVRIAYRMLDGQVGLLELD